MLAYLFTDDSLLIHSSELLMISKGKHINYIATVSYTHLTLPTTPYV